MNIVVNAELQAYIDPLTADEHAALERSLLEEGCRDALVLWGDVLVDGHNRYALCQKHNLPFQTVQNPRFQTIDDVHLWMINQHLARRSVSNFQRGLLALRKSEIMAAQLVRAEAAAAEQTGPSSAEANANAPSAAGSAADSNTPPWGDEDPLTTREAIARAARLSGNQVVMIEKIQKHAAPEVVAAVRSGTISINAAAAVASLPAEEQVAAAAAGSGELKQAAKRVRDAKRKPREDALVAPDGSEPDPLRELRQRIAELTTENLALRRQIAELQAAMAG
ncbi:MAG: plasmid replication/partition related protein [Burkholderiales bacterium]|nr:plasmid replication/partition related protein [Burkholderiales bacterium]